MKSKLLSALIALVTVGAALFVASAPSASLASLAPTGAGDPTTDPATTTTDPTTTTTVGSTTTTTVGPTTTTIDSTTTTVEPTTTVALTTTTFDSTTTTTTTAVPAALPGTPLLRADWLSYSGAVKGLIAPADDGGSPILHYVIQRSPNVSPRQWYTIGTTSTLSFTATGLTNGRTYYFRVAAVNADGRGAFSAERAMQPSLPPPPEIDGSNVYRSWEGNGEVWLYWYDPRPAPGRVPIAYRVERRALSSTTYVRVADIPATSSVHYSRRMTGLTNGVTYKFRVGAIYAGGTIAWDYKDMTPRTIPSVPQGLTAVSGPDLASVDWKAPSSSGGATVTGYRVQVSYNGTTWQTCTCMLDAVTPAMVRTTNRWADIPATAGKRVYVRVAAVNEAGVGPYSAAVSTVVLTYPDPPMYFDVFPGNGSVFASWDPPEFTGYAPLRHYEVQIRRVGEPTWRTVRTTTSLSSTVTGLTNGVRYCIRVVARNTGGLGGVTYRLQFTSGTWVGYDPYGVACYA